MKLRRRVLVLYVLATALGLVGYAGFHAYVFSPPGVNREGFDRIRVGMTRREVEAVLGGPAGVRRGPERSYLAPDGVFNIAPAETVPPQADADFYLHCETWYGADDQFVLVSFRPDGTLRDKMFIRMFDPSLLKRIRQRLGL